MPGRRAPYPIEFRHQMVELVRDLRGPVDDCLHRRLDPIDFLVSEVCAVAEVHMRWPRGTRFWRGRYA